MLLDNVSFVVSEGQKVAIVGDNGVGKSTVMRLIGGDETGATGTIRVDGRLGIMRQLVGSAQDETTLRQFFVSLATVTLRETDAKIHRLEIAVTADASDRNGVRYAAALAAWGELGGYALEVLWDTVTTVVLALPFASVGERRLATFSGGEQKRLALEILLRGDDDILMLDEPDNFLDIPGKRWLEEQLQSTRKTVLFVSHDRELLAAVATKIVTLEGRGAWTHGDSFTTWRAARDARAQRLDDEHRRWADERDRLFQMMREMKRRAALNDSNASRARAMETRLRHFDDQGPPPEKAKDQKITMRLGGSRSGKRAVIIQQLSLDGLTYPFDAEVMYSERIGVLGRNGTGKSHFMRLLSGDTVAHEGSWRLGASVVVGYFNQTHDHPELRGRTLLAILQARDLERGAAMGRLKRYEIHGCSEQPWETLSGGQQARFQILLLELAGANLLLLDEPTDNLDLASAEALEDALGQFDGTVLAVTHDRWFLRGFDRFLVFDQHGNVTEELEPDTAWA